MKKKKNQFFIVLKPVVFFTEVLERIVFNGGSKTFYEAFEFHDILWRF